MSEKNIKAAGKNVAAKGILSGKKNDKKLLIFICIFMSVVIITGAIFGTVYAVRNANAALEYNGVRMSGGVARYFSSYAKALYLNSELADVEGAADTEEFWNTPEMGTKTYGEGMIEYQSAQGGGEGADRGGRARARARLRRHLRRRRGPRDVRGRARRIRPARLSDPRRGSRNHRTGLNTRIGSDLRSSRF